MVTLAQEWFFEGMSKGRLEGRLEGEKRGEIKVIENLLKSGISWDVIYKATGINQAGFQELKEKLQNLQS